MKRTTTNRNAYRLKRHRRVRSRVSGTASCPRLSVYKSLQRLYVQVIDDTKGQTIVALSSKDFKTPEEFGKAIAKACAAKNITQIVFDRGGHPYSGKIKAMADAAREQKLQF